MPDGTAARVRHPAPRSCPRIRDRHRPPWRALQWAAGAHRALLVRSTSHRPAPGGCLRGTRGTVAHRAAARHRGRGCGGCTGRSFGGTPSTPMASGGCGRSTAVCASCASAWRACTSSAVPRPIRRACSSAPRSHWRTKTLENGAIASWDPTSSICPRVTSAWIRRSRAHACAASSTTKSPSSCPTERERRLSRHPLPAGGSTAALRWSTLAGGAAGRSGRRVSRTPA